MSSAVSPALSEAEIDLLAYARAATRRPTPEPYERAAAKVGRSDPCPCGSGEIFKRCCGSPECSDRIVH